MKKMEGEKPHRSGSSSSSELFICFTSRASSSNSSSMKISSKSILSPGRTDKFRDGSSILHTSLSRRLRSNGSMKGGQASPMFPAGNKKKGCAFDTPEPSSPKVTCIGQVRVRTKKQGKKMRSRSKRQGEASFRKTEQTQEGQQQQECLPNRNQRWVHLPLSICEALRTFGAEFNCFLPCGGRSSCSSNAGAERVKGEKSASTASPPPGTTSSCGAVFARWLMVLQESEEEKRGELVDEMVGLVGEEEEERREKTEETKTEEKEDIEEEEAGICIPPKNALLLMRCRSEPLRMSSFASRFWESPVRRDEEEEEEEDEDVDEEEEDEQEDEGEGEAFEMEVNEDAGEGVNEVQGNKDEEGLIEIDVKEEKEEKKEEMPEKSISSQENEHPLPEEESPSQNHENPEKEEAAEVEETSEKAIEEEEQAVEHQSSEEDTENHGEREEQQQEEEEMVLHICSSQDIEEQEFVQDNGQEAAEVELQSLKEEEEEEEEAKSQERRLSCSKASVLQEESSEEEKEKEETDPEVSREEDAEEEEKSTDEKDRREENPIAAEPELEPEPVAVEKARITAAEAVPEKEGREEKRSRGAVQLPECLLLMMCEPKLSMEVSKETWVCSTDFLRCRPSKPADHQQQQRRKPKNEAAAAVAGEEQRRRSSTDSNPSNQPISMATVVEQKLVSSAAYEPFVLTRCKSEPMRSSAKLAPEACFWKSRKLPHVGVGAAGIGF